MDNTKHNQSAAARDSDDLIAELARLVAQDARNTSSRSDAYKREEPRFSTEPAPAEPVRNDLFENEAGLQPLGGADPQLATKPSSQPEAADDALGGFASGWQAAEHEPPVEAESSDPIAELIADAEVEAYDRDIALDTAPVEDIVQDVAGGPQADVFDPAAHHPASVAPQSQGTNRNEDRDPLSEIEALIGEAARANSSDTGLSGRRVRSSFLDDTPTEDAVNAAESAILAAAAATQTPIRRAEPVAEPETWHAPQEPRSIGGEAEEPRADEPAPAPYPDYVSDPLFPAAVTREEPSGIREEAGDFEGDEEGEYEAGRPNRKISGFVVPVAAGAVILTLIGGVYFTFFAGPPDPGEAPILTADAQPLKQEAEPTQVETAASESVVFNEIEGNTASPEDEALVSRDQTGGASGSGVARVLAPEEGEIELANRPVRTVTVRPDGTIVPAQDSVAGSNVLPVERPDVPPVPNSTLTADPIGEAIAQAMAGEATTGGELRVAGAVPVDAEMAAGASGDEATADEPTAPATDVAAAAATDEVAAPRPIPRPAGLTAQGVATTTQVADTTPVAPAPSSTPPATTSSSTNVGAWVQLSSQRTQQEAEAGIPTLQALYGSLFNGATPEVSRVDLGERGIYYRVRLPQPTLADANSVCGAIKGQGGDCFVMDN